MLKDSISSGSCDNRSALVPTMVSCAKDNLVGGWDVMPFTLGHRRAATRAYDELVNGNGTVPSQAKPLITEQY